jgi:hypothetical protein
MFTATITSPKINQLTRVKALLTPISMECLGVKFDLIISRDMKEPQYGRIFIQLEYKSPCNKTGEDLSWKGTKHYLSEHMTDDEIVKRCWVAFEQAVKHEIMEGFRYNGEMVFNPHTPFTRLIEASRVEVTRK